MKYIFILTITTLLASCSEVHDQTLVTDKTTDTTASLIDTSALNTIHATNTVAKTPFELNDSLNSLVNIISGIKDNNALFDFVQTSTDFKEFSKNFEKRWKSFDSSRITHLKEFRDKELSNIVTSQATLFYPFSGPDILHAQLFFPNVERYVMVGLEPVGSLPVFKKEETDSLEQYFQRINTSLNAILKFSFFRTQSMKEDLKNEEVNGTLHLLCLFLKRMGNNLSSIKPIIIDSVGELVYLKSFEQLKLTKTNTRGVEIKFNNNIQQPQTLYYFSLNAADQGLKHNKNFTSYLKNIGTFNTYLKGASYLMHKEYFSIIRTMILTQSESIIQDDSGIAFKYFLDDNSKWNYHFYGQYTKPISMFSQYYQRNLDSLYTLQGSKPIGFGIGYNFRDKNSNFMIATKQH